MVFAVPTPLPGTIRDNMTYSLRMAGIRDRSVLDDRTVTALQQAALWDEVKDRLDDSAFAPSGGKNNAFVWHEVWQCSRKLSCSTTPHPAFDPLSTAMVEESLVILKQKIHGNYRATGTTSPLASPTALLLCSMVSLSKLATKTFHQPG